MGKDHESVSSEDELDDEQDLEDEEDVEEDDGAGSLSVSSEVLAPTTSALAGELVENGHQMATHGGGTVEAVDGFDFSYAMTEGFDGAETTAIDPELARLPQCCAEEFDIPESVCGRDDRARIRSTTRIPWRWNAQLIITMRDGRKSRCTGWFIGPHTVMTAGHCVYSHSAGGWARQIEVIPGMDASLQPFGSQKSSSFRSVQGWTVNQKSDYDYGAIVLPNNTMGNRVGWFGFAALTDASLRNLLVNNAGYAGDKPFGTLWYNAGRITKVTSRRLFYMIDTYGGHSGSPVWRYKDGHRHAVGVHAYGGCPNKSTRITKKVFNNMKTWKA
ncbi:MAG: serine protease [Actinobacteria bacterium]|nr:serine protease [Actinomycetota bacterium]